jgi:KDO2-lipid IV(A) lauroyltransferase
MVSALLRHFAYYWADLFRFSQLPPERAEAILDRVDGLEHVERTHAAGKGVIVLTGHFGVYELGSVLLARERLPVSVVFVPDRFEDVERFRGIFRGLGEVEAIAIDPEGSWSSLPVLRALRAGRLVAMQGDRDFGAPGIPATFFGERVRFPRGPFVVAMLTGAPVVPTFISYTRRLGFATRFYPPIEVPAGCNGDRDGLLAAAVQRWATVLEGEVRSSPTQWFTFYDWFARHRVGDEEPLATPAPARRASA